MRIKCLLSSAPSRDKCLSHQGELKALIRQLQTAHHMKAGTQGLANTLCFIPGRVALVCRAACPLCGERRGGGRLFYSHVYTFYTLIFSDRHPNYPRASGSALLHEGCCEGCCFAARRMLRGSQGCGYVRGTAKGNGPSDVGFRVAAQQAQGRVFGARRGVQLLRAQEKEIGQSLVLPPCLDNSLVLLEDHLGFRDRTGPLSLPRAGA